MLSESAPNAQTSISVLAQSSTEMPSLPGVARQTAMLRHFAGKNFWYQPPTHMRKLKSYKLTLS